MIEENMKKLFLFVTTFVITVNLYSIDINTIKKFSEFNSLDNYKSYIDIVIKECLDARSNDIEGNKCLVRTQIWEEELDYIYNKLYSSLNTSSKAKLQNSQFNWIKERDETYAKLVTKISSEYPKHGTMFRLIKNSELDIEVSKFIIERILILRKMFNTK